jgi:hypothetical protein
VVLDLTSMLTLNLFFEIVKNDNVIMNLEKKSYLFILSYELSLTTFYTLRFEN